jgi:hypothetical protein
MQSRGNNRADLLFFFDLSWWAIGVQMLQYSIIAGKFCALASDIANKHRTAVRQPL